MLEMTASASAVREAYKATLVIRTSPLPGAEPIVRRIPAVGLIRDLVPSGPCQWVCVVDGQPLRRDYWMQRRVGADEVIELHAVLQGGRGSASILQIIASIAIAVYAPQLAAAWGVTSKLGIALIGAGLNVAAGVLINALVPIESPNLGGMQGQSSTYNIALSGNQARLGQPIPVIYGRMQVYPDFAAQPYVEYDHAVNEAGDQYYFALLAVGHGTYVLESLNIDDTDIDHFSDVQYNVLPPGSAPTLVNPAVVTAPEVTGQDMLSGQYIGGFSACAPRRRATAIGIDIVFPRGLGMADSGGDIDDKTVTWRVEWREINDFGRPVTPWAIMASETLTLALNEPVRRSYRYELAQPARVEIRVVRTDTRDDNIRALNDLTWGGMRAYLDDAAPLAPTVTHIEVRIRASEQLSGLSQRKLAAIVRRKLRTWAPETGWGAEVETRSIAWALADKWSSAVYGDGLPDSRIDLQTLYELDQVWAARQDRLDIIFDTRVDSASADSTIAQCGRAACFWRQGVRTLARDQRQDLPVTAYTSRNMLPGTATIQYVQITEDTADGVIVEYFDNRAWDWLELLCPAPYVSEPVNAVRVRLYGITGPTHAEREGLYQAAASYFRRRFASWQTEMQGIFSTFGSPVVFAPVMHASSQSGDIAFWDEGTSTAGLTEPPVWTQGAEHYMRILLDNGRVTDPIPVTPGPTEYDVVLEIPSDLVLDIVVDDAARERPKYLFGTGTVMRSVVRVLGVRPAGQGDDGAPTYSITGVIEDDRVHAADEHLLPGPGDEQDPVDPGEDDGGGGGSISIVTLTDQRISAYAPAGIGPPAIAKFTLYADGRASREVSPGDDGEVFITGQWINPQPVESETAAEWEVRVTLLAGALTSGPVGTWEPLDVDRQWVVEEIDGGTSSVARLRVEIRDIDSGIVQASASVDLEAYVSEFGA